MSDGIRVHQTHCCRVHGCKYGDDDCPVEFGGVFQDYPCEYCPGNHYFTCNLTAEELYALRDLASRAWGFGHSYGVPLRHTDELIRALDRPLREANEYLELDRHYAKLKEARDERAQ